MGNLPAPGGGGGGVLLLQIQEFLKETMHLENPDIRSAVERISVPVSIKRGEVLIRLGECPENLYLLVDGVFRGYFFDDGGREITECFAYRPGTPVMACTEIGMMSNINLVALNDSTCLSMPVSELRMLMVLYPELLKLANDLLLDALQYHWKVKSQLYKHKARERYQWFRETHPGLTELVGGKYVASFLNMSPVTLSRLRRELKEEEE